MKGCPFQQEVKLAKPPPGQEMSQMFIVCGRDRNCISERCIPRHLIPVGEPTGECLNLTRSRSIEPTTP